MDQFTCKMMRSIRLALETRNDSELGLVVLINRDAIRKCKSVEKTIYFVPGPCVNDIRLQKTNDLLTPGFLAFRFCS